MRDSSVVTPALSAALVSVRVAAAHTSAALWLLRLDTVPSRLSAMRLPTLPTVVRALVSASQIACTPDALRL